MRIGLILLIAGGLSFFQPPQWERKVNPELLTAFEQQDELSFLVQMKERADVKMAARMTGKENKGKFVFENLKRHAEQTQMALMQFLDQEEIIYQSFFIVNMLKIKGDLELLQKIAGRDDVAYIYNDLPFNIDIPEVELSANNRSAEPEWGLLNIKADSVWAMGYKGEGVVIAGQDTGYEWEHPALSGQYRGNLADTVIHEYNWHDAIHEDINGVEDNPCGYNSVAPCDDHSHGTHTMGTMIGFTSENIIGVAPESKWIACKNMDQGTGIPSTYIECFEWFLAPTNFEGENPDPSKSPHIINNSWSCPDTEGCNSENFVFMEEAISNIKAAGIFLSISAGNNGSQGCGSVYNPPAFFENSFAVGSYRKNDTISGFSSRGPSFIDSVAIMKPNISAPGSSVRSARLDSTYGNSSGTSMAAPHVAGAVALILSAVPQIDGDVTYLEQLLQSTARPATTDQECEGLSGSSIPNYTYGYGRLNVLAAVKKAMADFSVSTETVNKEDFFNVGPNPFNSFIRFENKRTENLEVRLFGIQGELIRSWNTNATKADIIDTKQLESGVYILSVKTDKGLVSKKLIKV